MVTDRSNIEEMLFDSLMGHRNGIMVVESVVDTRHMAGIVNHGSNVVAHDDDGAGAVEFGKGLVHLLLKALVDVGVGLVKDKHLGVGDDSTRKQHALKLATRELAYMMTGQVAEFKAGEDVVNLATLKGIEAALPPVAGLQTRGYNVVDGDGEMTVYLTVLGEIAYAEVVDSLAVAEESHASGIGFLESEDDTHERSLATAVGTDDSQIVVRVNLERDMLQYRLAVITGADVVEGDNGTHGGGCDTCGWLGRAATSTAWR